MAPGRVRNLPMSNQILRMLLLAVAIAAGSAAAPARASAQTAQPVRHIVIFKYKAGTSDAQIKEVTDAFRALQKSIPGIQAFEDGVNNSPEKKNLGFTHAYVLTFENAAARDAYLPHPEHDKFGQLLGKLKVVEDVFVFDYAPVPR
jgi:hypothetical protein